MQRPCTAALVCLLAGALWACGHEPAMRVELNLTALGSCSVAGETVPLEVEGRGDGLRLMHRDARPLDFFLRLPRAAVFLFELPSGLSSEAFRVSLASEDRSQAVSLVRTRSGGWRAELPELQGEVARLRLENLSGQPLAWGRPRIVGDAEPLGPALTAAPPGDPAPNVLLYVVDALRADRLSLYGYGLPTSPELDELAASSVVFTNAYSTGPDTGHGIPSLFASLPSPEVQGRLRVSDRSVRHTLAERFQAAGYATAAFQANLWVKLSGGFGRGFETYEMVRGRMGGELRLASAADLHARLLEWLAQPREQPFFLYVQSFDVHQPYAPPPPFLGRFSKGPRPASRIRTGVPKRMGLQTYKTLRDAVPVYDDAVAYADHEIGQLIDALTELGLRDSTVIVITSDHGEALGERGRFHHAISLHEEQVRIPLIVSVPWQARAERREEVVSLMDLAPTLLELAGLEIPAQFRGQNLLRPPETHRPRLALGNRSKQEWFVREGPWKWVVQPGQAELFHLPSDPEEAHDLSLRRPLVAGYLSRLLWENSRVVREHDYQSLALDYGLDENERKRLGEALKALGYVD